MRRAVDRRPRHRVSSEERWPWPRLPVRRRARSLRRASSSASSTRVNVLEIELGRLAQSNAAQAGGQGVR